MTSKMFEIFKKFGVLTTIFFLIFFIDQIRGTHYYEINDEYPISVQAFHGSYSKITFKRSAQHAYLNRNEVKKSKLIQKKLKHSRKGHACVRCPQLITAIANEGLDGILVTPPNVLSCKTNMPYSSSLFKIETLFGPEMSIVLPQGRHMLQANIRNIENGLIVQSCVLKYNVIVRRCLGYPNIKNNNLTMSCTAGTLWGSKCAFRCKNDDEYLSHHEFMFCNEMLEWVGEEPSCSSDINNEVLSQPEYIQDDPKNDDKNDEFCKYPEPPANGQFKCDIKKIDLRDMLAKLKANSIDSFRTLGAGTTCKVQCNHFYSMPYHLHPLSVVECANGAWNRTDIEFCYKEGLQRQHLSKWHTNEVQKIYAKLN